MFPPLIARTPACLILLWLGLAQGMAQSPVVTEFMARNESSLLDGLGQRSDWIEVHNPHDEALSLAGYRLRDEDSDWSFPHNVMLEPNGYLLVFASGLEGTSPEGEWHAPFALSGEGEPLSLVDSEGNEVSGFDEVPPQRTDVSYGVGPKGETLFFVEPTPGAPNGAGMQGFVADTQFSVKRGFFEEAFVVEITTATEGARIFFTTDGRDPREGTLFNPVSLYEGPLSIDRTTVVRAFAMKERHLPTNVDSQTYIFPKDVIRQPEAPPGFPATWGEFTGTNGSARGRDVPADYEMNADMVEEDPDAMEAALKSLPSLSIVMDPGDLFGKNGILSNPFGGVDGSGVHTMNPFERDRHTSVEWIDPNGGPEMQVDCGIRLSGGWSRHYIATPKKSFTLLFKEAFGPKKLRFPVFPESPVEEFDRLILKAIFSNAWPDAARPPEYLRDHFTRQTRIDMGEPSTHGTWVHLYLNGLYWGIYNPTERPDASYAASHYGGEKEDYDALKHAGLRGPGQATNDQHEVADGTADRWEEALRLARSGLEGEEGYAAFQELVDVQNLADYAILNIYAANVDWPHKNWYANGRRDGSPGFRFYSWDCEYAWHDVNADRTLVSNRNTPAELFSRVRRNQEFQRLFGDRVQRHLFGVGALTEEANIARYERMAAVIEPAILAEAARWGDASDTRQGRSNYTKARWEGAKNGVINTFLKKRHPVAIEQFIGADLYPELEAPRFSKYGGEVEEGAVLTMRSKDVKNLLRPSGGEIYYTLDGTDPRRPDNQLNEAAILYDGPMALVNSGQVRARLRQSNLFTGGNWSALTEARFVVGARPATSANLVVSKIHYRPQAPTPNEVEAGHRRRSDFEYVELWNFSHDRIHLGNVEFVDGIDYRFAEGVELEAGARILLAGNETAFRSRFGSGLPIAGEFQGKLSDGGERLRLVDGSGATVFVVEYGDEAPWPETADGSGAALVLKEAPDEAQEESRADHWTSAPGGGSPGTDPVKEDGVDVLDRWLASQGEMRLTEEALLRFAFARDLGNEGPLLELRDPGAPTMVMLAYTRRSEVGDGVRIIVEMSRDLERWEEADLSIAREQAAAGGTTTVEFEPISRNTEEYFRLLVMAEPR